MTQSAQTDLKPLKHGILLGIRRNPVSLLHQNQDAKHQLPLRTQCFPITRYQKYQTSKQT